MATETKYNGLIQFVAALTKEQRDVLDALLVVGTSNDDLRLVRGVVEAHEAMMIESAPKKRGRPRKEKQANA